MNRPPPDLQADVLRAGYLSGRLSVREVVDGVYDRIAARGDDGVWITPVPRAEALRRAAELDGLLVSSRRGATGAGTAEAGTAGAGAAGAGAGLPPLFGLPFAVKDNIDLAGLPTTAGCPDFGYLPADSAPAVARLLTAGAVCVGKTNLDQFATGLSGARSPYGIPASPFDPHMISGGSSSGSGVAVADGLVTFAVGTDTAGSGRVPAALTNTVGLKPSRGLVSTRGVVPACRSLDCPSVFALSVPDAYRVLSVMRGYDAEDPYSRRFPGPGDPAPAWIGGPEPTPSRIGVPEPAPSRRGGPGPARPRVGVPRADQLDFLGDAGAAAVFGVGVGLLADGGAEVTEIDLGPFLEAGTLLYGGPWLAERYAAVEAFLRRVPDAGPTDPVHPVIRAVLEPGAAITGAEVFRGLTRLRALRRGAERTWADVDVIVVPTVPTTYRIDAMLADPIRLNANLGRYTTFANLLDLAAVAVPVGFAAGLPFGVTLLAPAGGDDLLAAPAELLHRRSGVPVGAGSHSLLLPAGAAAEIPT
ncbi:allophanate hydrolase [Parafrankia discariae]|uniref:allophanate hydrolase n=1 Tax=Parafrankia discariae TaxID=365528 RepID=UPI00037500FA|nr:allophanate hydrolase [Parafrankia discariae]